MASAVASGAVATSGETEPASIAWDEVVGVVHGQMRSLVGPTRDLEDLTQTALEQVARSIDRFEGRARLATFTYRICTHVALNHWRSWRRWLARFEAWGERTSDDAMLEDLAASIPERLALLERRRRLHAALRTLSPLKRLTLTLVDLEELPVARVAEILECPEPTVRSRLATARRELYERLRRDPLFSTSAASVASEGETP
jgi:RNA polymerase sigma-70 factor (ECF subfamily)